MSIIDRNSKKKEQNLWETFLSDATLGNSFRDSHVLFLGPRNTGKRTLINSIFQNVIAEANNNNKVGPKGYTSALEYTYIRIKNPEDPENDDYISKMNVWILDDPVMHDLLWHCIREDTIENMMICVCLDMTEPWNALSTLSEWMSIISDKVTRILRDMPLYKQDNLREKLAKYVKTYEQPKFDEDGKLIIPKRVNENPDEDQFDIPLPEGVLKINFGVPIMILGTKADGLEVLEKEKEGEYKLDFLQYSLRNFGLPYAATLLYLSLKQNINLDILYDYILHRLYGFGLKYNAEVIHKDSIFIPSGYDKPKIINETFQKIKQGDIFEEIIAQPTGKKAMNKEELTADETQAFLTKLKTKIQTSTDGQAPDSTRQSNGSTKELVRAPSIAQTDNKAAPPTSTLGFFEKLKGNPTEGGAKPSGEGTPSHARVVSHQIPSTNAPSMTDATANRTTINPANTAKTKQNRAEKLMELLKK